MGIPLTRFHRGIFFFSPVWKQKFKLVSFSPECISHSKQCTPGTWAWQHKCKKTNMFVYFQGSCPIKLLVSAKMTFDLFQGGLVHKNFLPLALSLYYWFMAPLNTRKQTSFVIYGSKNPLVYVHPLKWMEFVVTRAGPVSGQQPSTSRGTSISHSQRDASTPPGVPPCPKDDTIYPECLQLRGKQIVVLFFFSNRHLSWRGQ